MFRKSTPPTPSVDLKSIATPPPQELDQPINPVESTSVILIQEQTAPKQSDQDPETTIRQYIKQIYYKAIQPENSKINPRQLDNPNDEIKAQVIQIIDQCIQQTKREIENGKLPSVDESVINTIRDEIYNIQFGLGPLEGIFKRYKDLEDIVLLTRKSTQGEIYCEAWALCNSGRYKIENKFDPVEILNIINRHLAREGKTVNPNNPIIDGRLLNGARVAVIYTPLVDPMFRITIRVPTLVARSMQQLIDLNSISSEAASFLGLALRARLSIVVAGSTGCGKTNMLQALCNMLPDDESVIVIEDTRELNVPGNIVSYFQTGFQSQEPGKFRYNQNHLAIASMRHIPERIVFGEVRDAASWEAIKLANSGHPMLLTVHAEEPEQIIERLLLLARESPSVASMPDSAIRRQILSGFQIFIFLQRERMADDKIKRFVVQIAESPGIFREDRPVINTLFKYDYAAQKLVWTGIRPHEMTIKHMANAGISAQMIEDALNGRRKFWQEFSHR
ncbi:MAG: ATPase, T2SS/T4P/T4SS family [Methylacidiphilales bacterium]|nr:ATPase, T2SS/T4P/T4SS family [Candidatus Methylacidiphilales bacterium]